MAEPEKVRSSEASGQPIAVELIAVLVAVADGRPLAMTIDDGRGLPSGPFEVEHRSLQAGMRAWVERQTRLPPGYVEQLYTFADPGRRNAADEARAISISYLGLTREERTAVPRTVETAPVIAATRVDLISVGWLTHSAPILDIGLDAAT
ncbi:MAG: hypothetical protein JO312_20435 [Hyphomicrobiales bacterium]|nr:hypothetical protein [Hyphomicrobiales bacterium]